MPENPHAALLEAIAREAEAPMHEVVALFEREHAALAREATVPNYVTLLAARRVRAQLLSTSRH